MDAFIHCLTLLASMLHQNKSSFLDRYLLRHVFYLSEEDRTPIIEVKNCNAAAAAAKSLQSCPTLFGQLMAAHQAPPSLGFSRQEHWSGLPFPSPMRESEK